jgi:O-antigen ligase
LGSLLELGAVGLLALLGFLATGFVTARMARRRLIDNQQRHLALVISASIVGVVSSFATFDALNFPMVAGLTFLLVGMAATAWQLSRSQGPSPALSKTPDDPVLAGAPVPATASS